MIVSCIEVEQSRVHRARAPLSDEAENGMRL
jgi:hypothetical protein